MQGEGGEPGCWACGLLKDHRTGGVQSGKYRAEGGLRKTHFFCQGSLKSHWAGQGLGNSQMCSFRAKGLSISPVIARDAPLTALIGRY